MLDHAYAPNRCPAPELYIRYTWVEALHLNWDDVGERPSRDDIQLLAQCINIKREADELRAKVKQSARS